MAMATYASVRQEHGLERGAAREEPFEDELECRGVPVQRVPLGRRRLEDRVDRAEGDAEDDVERQQEEQREPGDPGQRQAGPEAVAAFSLAYLAVGVRHPP